MQDILISSAVTSFFENLLGFPALNETVILNSLQKVWQTESGLHKCPLPCLGNCLAAFVNKLKDEQGKSSSTIEGKKCFNKLD